MSVARQRARLSELLGTGLLDSPWLHRLAGISFLGTLDNHPRSRRISNRYEHSLGVAGLGADAALALELDPAATRLFVAACLVHDIGHYPLSHAAEPAFAKVLGADHHEVSRWIILGDDRIPRRSSLRPVLERAGIDAEAVWAILDRNPGLAVDIAPLAELLRSAINLDTLEGIPRVARDFRLATPKLAAPIFTRHATGLAIRPGALGAIDGFWSTKDKVYDRVINLPSNILAEARLCDLVATEIGPQVFDDFARFDDAALRTRLGERAWLAAALDPHDDENYELWTQLDYGERIGAADRPAPVLSRMRKRYFVDPSVQPDVDGLGLDAWSRRYRHERERAYLVSRLERQLDLPLNPITDESPEV